MKNETAPPITKETLEYHQQQCVGKSAQDLVSYFLNVLGNEIVLASSLSIEDQTLTDMCLKASPKTRIIVLDTGRLNQETYTVMQETMDRYGFSYEFFFPNAEHIENMMKTHGPNSMYTSLERRKQCCFIRKVEPLKRALKTCKAWITGLRREQATTRTTIEPIEWDNTFNIAKINPLAIWTEEEVWGYIKREKIPYNKLYDQGYRSIGCAPCTRPIKSGEDPRAGRWWWENKDHKECGIHADLTRKNK